MDYAANILYSILNLQLSLKALSKIVADYIPVCFCPPTLVEGDY